MSSTNNPMTAASRTALVAAKSKKQREYLEVVLKRALSPHEKDENGWTDLHYAAFGHWAAPGGLKAVARFLLDAGANVNARMRDDGQKITEELATNMDWLRDAGRTEWWRYGETPLHIAAHTGASKVAAVLLQNSADTEAKRSDGSTPLHIAVQNSPNSAVSKPAYTYIDGRPVRMNVAALLLQHGADVGSADEHGRTPLHIAAQLDFDKVAALLLKYGADIGAGMPLHTAAAFGAKKVAALLVENGADLRAKNVAGETPLDVAMQSGRGNLLNILQN